MVESTGTKSMSYFAFIRHGERSDQVYEKDVGNPAYRNQIAHDPFLTETGLKQVEAAGHYFKERIKAVEKENGINFDEIRVESSPFLRTLQTAAGVAKAVDLPNVHIEYRVCGYLVHRCYKHVQGNIFDGLDVKNNKNLKD